MANDIDFERAALLLDVVHKAQAAGPAFGALGQEATAELKELNDAAAEAQKKRVETAKAEEAAKAAELAKAQRTEPYEGDATDDPNDAAKAYRRQAPIPTTGTAAERRA